MPLDSHPEFLPHNTTFYIQVKTLFSLKFLFEFYKQVIKLKLVGTVYESCLIFLNSFSNKRVKACYIF